MTNLLDITHNVLSQNCFCFEIRDINPEQIPVPIQNAKFGILNFIAVTAEETSEENDFLFVVDCSFSMSEKCADGRSKMQHIIHTLKNMVLFFYEHPNVKVHFTIDAFDTQFYHIVTRTKITDDNLNEIINKIEQIKPLGSTNIEFALIKSAEQITYLQTQFPKNIINHIFMTDGEATDGSQNIDELQSIVNPNITNAFIGFGIGHDSSLLNGISSIGKSAYYFIDKLESAGLVYGEILHGIVYKLITSPEIIINNGLVYDYKTNTWVQSLKICDIVSEANKTYNIISSDPENCSVNIKGNINDIIVSFPATQIETVDLTTQIYRQRTLQLLYEANDLNSRNRTYNNSIDVRFIRFSNTIQPAVLDFQEENKNFKLKLANFIEEIKEYMIDNNLTEDKFLKNLCDDIYICYRTFGTKFGTMYCTSRQTSQGTQRVYTTSYIEDTPTQDLYRNTYPIPGLYRQVASATTTHPSLFTQLGSIQLDDQLDEQFHYETDLPILHHEVSDFVDTPYLAPQATQIMREISRPTANFTEDYKNDELTTYESDFSILHCESPNFAAEHLAPNFEQHQAHQIFKIMRQFT